jgi:hypothetical protein
LLAVLDWHVDLGNKNNTRQAAPAIGYACRFLFTMKSVSAKKAGEAE